MMCYYLNVQFQGKRVNLPQGKRLEVFEIKIKKNFFPYRVSKVEFFTPKRPHYTEYAIPAPIIR